MKRFFIAIFTLLCIGIQAQTLTFDVADIVEDSIYWETFSGNSAVFNFTSLNANDAELTVYQIDIDNSMSPLRIIPTTAVYSTEWPVTLDKTVYFIYTNTDTINTIRVKEPGVEWAGDAIGWSIDLGTVTSGELIESLR